MRYNMSEQRCENYILEEKDMNFTNYDIENEIFDEYAITDEDLALYELEEEEDSGDGDIWSELFGDDADGDGYEADRGPVCHFIDDREETDDLYSDDGFYRHRLNPYSRKYAAIKAMSANAVDDDDDCIQLDFDRAPELNFTQVRLINDAVEDFISYDISQDAVAVCLALILAQAYLSFDAYKVNETEISIKAKMLLGAHRSDDIDDAIEHLTDLIDKINYVIEADCRSWIYYCYCLIFGRPSWNPHFKCLGITL